MAIEAPGRSSDVEQAAWVEELVRVAMSRVPFYRDHLTGADASSLFSLPTFDKAMISAFGLFPLSSGGPHGAHRVAATSGTSGDRLCVAFDRTDWDRLGLWMEEVGQRVGLNSTDVLLNTHCYGLWVGGPALDVLADRVGAGLVPIGPGGPAGVLQFLADGIGTAISATPSYLRRLMETAAVRGFDLTGSGLRLGFIGAEPAEASLRRKLLAYLPRGFAWVELYGLTETAGPSVAFSPDPDVPELLLNTKDFWVEVLDLERDTPVALGTAGELTITSRAVGSRTPLIRYRTRDMVRVVAGEVHAPTRISRILGRVDDALKVAGVLVYPSAVSEVMSDLLPPSAEWRAVIRRRGDDDELVVEAEASRTVCQAVEVAFAERLGLGVAVTPASGSALVRSHMKTHRILVESPTANFVGHGERS